MIYTALVVALGIAQSSGRPTHARATVPRDALADATSASLLLKPFLDIP